MSSPRYTVILRGEHRFTLSRTQIQRDSPQNFFACCFLLGFTEAESRTIELDQDPALFAIIVQHMSGYKILPLSPSLLPAGMTHEMAMENLVRDARFFGLDGLYKLLTSPTFPAYIKDWDGLNGPIVEFEDVVHARLPQDISYTDKGLCSVFDGVASNVLVYGRNMPLILTWGWDIEAMTYGEEADSGFTYKFRLKPPPSQVRSLKKQDRGWLSPFARDPANPSLSASTSTHTDASIQIDGRKAFLRNVPLWLEHMTCPPQERTQKPRYEEIRVFDELSPNTFVEYGPDGYCGEIQLWVDEAFFVIERRGHNREKGSLILELLAVKARTRGAILDSSFPLFVPENVDTNS